MTIRKCPGCGSTHHDVIYEVAGVPASSQWVLPSRADAIALRRGDMALAFCGACGLVFNAAFEPALIADAGAHQEMPSCSPMERAFQRRLADQVSQRYALPGKEILEIGGRGELVGLLCQRGARRGGGAGIDAASRCAYVDDPPICPTDLVCSEMLLEGVADPGQFLRLLQRTLSLRAGTRLFLLVSNFVHTLRAFAFWEIHYARRSYLSPGTLYRLLCAHGLSVSDIWTDFDAQYLMADARADDGGAGFQPGATVETIGDLQSLVVRFAHECREKQALWCEILRRIAGAGNRIAIWGAGPAATSFLTTLAVGDEVSYVVDSHPCRQGRYTPGTGHRIIAPEAMLAQPPDVVIVTNSVLTFEIQQLLAELECAPTMLIA